MNLVEYQRYTDEVRQWAAWNRDVLGFVAVGSTAGVDRTPDRFSDHDLMVVTVPAATERLLSDLSWLPGSDRITMVHHETDNGRGIVYDDGHLVEIAVLSLDEIDHVSLNAYRVLVDKASISPRLAENAARTAHTVSSSDADGTERFHRFIQELIVGSNRYARGELLSANERIRGRAATALVDLLATFVPAVGSAALDTLDSHRRFELLHPDLGARMNAAVDSPLLNAATTMLAIAEEQLRGRIPAANQVSLDSARRVITSNRGARTCAR